jgi:hypothetical protein
MFIACHPVLSTEARVALTLKLLGGLTTEEISRAFLSTEPAVAQRIVRAKRTLASKQIPFEVPPEPERSCGWARCEVIYPIGTELRGNRLRRLIRPELAGRGAPASAAGLISPAGRRHARTALAGDPGIRCGPGFRPRPGSPSRCGTETRGTGPALIRRGSPRLLRAERLGLPPPAHGGPRAARPPRPPAPVVEIKMPSALPPAADCATLVSRAVEPNRGVATQYGPERGLEPVDPLTAEPNSRPTSAQRPRRPVGWLGPREEARAEFGGAPWPGPATHASVPSFLTAAAARRARNAGRLGAAWRRGPCPSGMSRTWS